MVLLKQFLSTKKLNSIVFLLLSMIGVSGCTTNLDYPTPSPRTQGALIGGAGGAAIGTLASGTTVGTVAGGAIGAVVGGAIGDSIERRQSLATQLNNQGIRIIEVGDVIKIVIPTDDYFIGSTPKINPHYYGVLNKLALYIRPIPKESILVAGYTDNQQGGEWRALGLTRDQARAMAKYLWSQNIDARLIYPQGYGDHEPIACNDLPKGRAQNRRIEITFWRITKDDEF